MKEPENMSKKPTDDHFHAISTALECVCVYIFTNAPSPLPQYVHILTIPRTFSFSQCPAHAHDGADCMCVCCSRLYARIPYHTIWMRPSSNVNILFVHLFHTTTKRHVFTPLCNILELNASYTSTSGMSLHTLRVIH